VNKRLFNEFLTSGNTIWVYKGDRRLFTSDERGILPMLEYIETLAPYNTEIIIFDKVVGNALALLSVKAGSEAVYSPLGSNPAVKTLRNYGIRYHFIQTVPYIQNRNQDDMCPMEKLSINKSPEEFYEAVKRYYD